MDDWFRHDLVCPRDLLGLELDRDRLHCPNDHEYPVVAGIPVMLLEDVPQTLAVGRASLDAVREVADSAPLYIDSLGCSPEERSELRKKVAEADLSAVDPVVQYLIGATNGYLYRHLVGNLEELPIPELRLHRGFGKRLLDVGCNWGRWCIAAARLGYQAVGIDPSLSAVMAAKRTCARLRIPANFVVGDARFLPFRSNSFATVFSYSVLQHFSKTDAVSALHQVSRVLEPSGESLIQMPNALGVRSMQHQFRRGFREPKDFEVRYWTTPELTRTFRRIIGRTELSVDGFFGLGIQASDLAYMPLKYQLVIQASETLRRISHTLPLLSRVADSVYLRSTRD